MKLNGLILPAVCLLALAWLNEAALATPMRLRHSTKRVDSAAPGSQARELVDRDGRPLPKPFWNNDSPTGTPHVEVSLSQQVARVYFDGNLVGQSPISSGRLDFETPTGEFSIIDKRRTHHSNLYGSWINAEGKFAGEASAGSRAPSGLRYAPSPMPFFLRLTHTGLGFHAGFVPGFPASHGCIRLPAEMAEKFFENLPKGTKVVIKD